MDMFRAAMLVAVILIGGILALLGLVVVVSAATTGGVTISHGPGTSETVTHVTDSARFMRLVLGLGGLPFIAGTIMVFLGVRRLRR